MDQHRALLSAAATAATLWASSCGCPGAAPTPPTVNASEPSETAQPSSEPDMPCEPVADVFEGELLLPERFCLLPDPIATGCATELSWWTGTECPTFPEFVREGRPDEGGTGSWGSVRYQTFTVTRCALPGDRAPVIEVVFGHGEMDAGQLYTAIFADGRMIRLDRLPYGAIRGTCCGPEQAFAVVYGEPVRPDCTDGEVIGPQTFADSGDSGVAR